ncbi:TPA: LPXTG cell wall anchor domain-containing protein [Enterococcus faecalis]|nr:LPXTG cell wall anchor domain-containing protein [Enterococcus faecalis]HAP4921458.1 LPXTG cell wall anchor domain-containing protein [Enterococcus faecalis]
MKLKKLWTIVALFLLGVQSMVPVTQVFAMDTAVSTSETIESITSTENQEQSTVQTIAESQDSEKVIDSTDNRVQTKSDNEEKIGQSQNSNDSPVDHTDNDKIYSDNKLAYTQLKGNEDTDIKSELVSFMNAHIDEIQAIRGASYNAHVGYTASNGVLYEFIPAESPTQLRRSLEARAGITIKVVQQFNVNWHIRMPNTGLETWGAIFDEMATPDGKPLFCIEPGILVNGFDGYTQTVLPGQITKRMQQGASVGYTKTKDIPHYWNTQTFLWTELGVQWIENSGVNQSIQNEINTGIANLAKRPSFNNQQVTMKVGESITLTDSNGVFKDYEKMSSNTSGVKVERNGNQLKLTATATSNESGTVNFKKYSVEPVSIAYVKPGSQAVAWLMDPDNALVKLNIKVIKNGNAQVKKIDKATGKPLAGAVFKFTNLSTKETKEITSNAQGIAQWNDILAATQVKIEEIKAPNGYILTKETKTVTIEPSKTVSVTLDNKEQLANLKIFKEDSETGNKPQGAATLDGAVYGLYDSAGKEVKKVTLTEKDGIVQGEIKGLKLGKYTLKELEAPEGYVLDPKEHAVELAYAGQNVEIALKETTVKDRVIKGNIEGYKFGSRELIPSLLDPMNIFKKGSTSQRPPLKDVELTATSKTTGQMYVTKTDEKGYFKFANLPYDTYHIEETQGLDGYKLIEPFDVIVNSDGKTYFYLLEDELITSKLRVFKYDGETKEPLAGAKFKIFDTWANDGEGAFIEMTAPNSTEVTDTFETGKNGEMVLTETLPWGENRYELHEVEAPEGYLPLEKPIVFSVTGEEVEGMVSIEVPNTLARQDVELVKVDEMSQKPLENVPFQLIKKEKDGKETVIDTYKTDKNGKVSIEALGYGRYIFREVEPLENYYPLDNDIPFEVTVEHNGEKIELRAENKRKPLVITTVLATVDGKKEINPQVDNILRDKVMVQRAEKGHTYYVDSFYVDPQTKKELAKDQSTYTAKNESDTFFVDFKLQKDTMKDGQKGVATHYIYYDKEKTKLVGKETDLNNPDQSVVAKAPIVPAKKDTPVLPQTGAHNNVWLTLCGLVLLFGALGFYVFEKKVKNN